MNPQRPTVILVMAILNFVVGAIALAFQLCCHVLTIAGMGFLQSLTPGQGPPLKGTQPNPTDVLASMPKITEFVPGYFPMHVGGAVLGIILAGVLIVAGIGLLSMQPWARKCCIVFGILQILLSLANLAFALFVENPGTRSFQLAAHVRMNLPGPPPVSNQLATNLGSVFAFGAGVAYPLALLIVMFLPSVEAVFAGRASPESEPLDYDDRPLPPPPRSDDDRFRPYPT